MTYKPPSKSFDVTEPWTPSGPDERPSTLPKDSSGEAINEQRRDWRAAERAFEQKHGRKPNKAERKKLRKGS